MPRIEQINELLAKELSLIIQEELEMPNCLVTLAYIKSTGDLKNARVSVSVLPHNLSGTVLKKLRSKSGLFSRLLRERTRLNHIPKFYWTADFTEKNAAELEKAIEEEEEEMKHLND